MCIAIYQSPGYRLTEQELANSWRNNPDGAGLSFFDSSGEIVIHKTMNKSEFVDIYNDAVRHHGDESEMSVHFRIATHGSVNIDNCHPFMVPHRNISVIHNGIIPVMMEKKDRRSDTRVFVEDVFPLLSDNWLDDEQLTNMVEEYIGHSKLVVLTTEHEYSSYILNEHLGNWSDDKKLWFSNKSYCDINSYGSIGTYSGSWSSPTLWSASQQKLPKCVMCAENAVFDDVCYECETCQKCSYTAYTRDCGCHDEELGIYELTENKYVDLSNRGKR